jgi:hypothetical protein
MVLSFCSNSTGYKFKVSYMASSEIEIKIREESLAKVIFGG